MSFLFLSLFSLNQKPQFTKILKILRVTFLADLKLRVLKSWNNLTYYISLFLELNLFDDQSCISLL